MKNLAWIKFISLTIIVFCVAIATQVNATSKTSTSKKSSPIVKIFYFKDNPNARTSLFQHPNSINVLAPQTYAINDLGLLEGNIDPPLFCLVLYIWTTKIAFSKISLSLFRMCHSQKARPDSHA